LVLGSSPSRPTNQFVEFSPQTVSFTTGELLRHPAKAFTLAHLEIGNLCASYVSEVTIGGILSASEKLIMSTATTAPECQTLDISSAAIALGVCKETVRRLVRRKVLRKLPGLRRIIIPRIEIHRYLNER
jgi:Helix-turn-helix domain